MTDWRDRAACAGLAYDLAFPSRAGARWDSAAMLDTCHTCPVREPCLTDALQAPSWQQVGIRGGLYASERLTILRSRAA